MKIDLSVLDETERIIFALRTLYNEHGYHLYRMSKFKEYDLYSKNKDFLVSDAVITFTDTDGKLMALKPDVTLSIIKNDKDDETLIRKLCYNENVYRVSRGTNAFKEIMQTGLECIGPLSDREFAEVLMLSAESLKLLSPNYMLEISDVSVISAFLDEITDDPVTREAILKCMGEKNIHEVREISVREGLDPLKTEKVMSLMSLFGTPDQVLPKLYELAEGMGIDEDIKHLETGTAVFSGTDMESHILMDFSVIGDMNYYNGMVFKGFISGIPESVLSGGRYDRLMQKMGRHAKAVGFAVYLDLLERLNL